MTRSWGPTWLSRVFDPKETCYIDICWGCPLTLIWVLAGLWGSVTKPWLATACCFPRLTTFRTRSDYLPWFTPVIRCWPRLTCYRLTLLLSAYRDSLLTMTHCLPWLATDHDLLLLATGYVPWLAAFHDSLLFAVDHDMKLTVTRYLPWLATPRCITWLADYSDATSSYRDSLLIVTRFLSLLATVRFTCAWLPNRL